MKTKFRFPGSRFCLGLLLAATFTGQSLIAAEPKPASPVVPPHQPMISATSGSDAGDVGQVPASILGNVATMTFEQIVGLTPSGQRHEIFSKIKHHDRSGDQVITGRTYTLRGGESAEGDVIVIHGHARIDGVVNGDLALVGSDAEIRGTINGDMVAIASRAHLEEGAVVNGDFSSVVSAVEHDTDAQVNGSRCNLDFLPTGTAVN